MHPTTRFLLQVLADLADDADELQADGTPLGEAIQEWMEAGLPDSNPHLVIIDGTPVEMLDRLGREFTEELGQLPPWDDDEPEGMSKARRRRMYAIWAHKRMVGG